MAITQNSSLVISMESARATAVTLTAVSNAAPGVFTGTHTFVAGEILLANIAGMAGFDNVIVQVFSVSTTVSFILAAPGGTAGLSTVGVGTFTSGTVTRLTLGTLLTAVGDFTPSGGDSKLVQYPTVTEAVDAQVIVGTNAASYAGTVPWDPIDAGQIALKAAADAGTPKGFRVLYKGGRTTSFYGTVGFAGMAGGGTQAVTTTPFTIALLGRVVNV